MLPSLALPASQSGSVASFPSTSVHLLTASFAIFGGPSSALQPVMRSIAGQPSSREVGTSGRSASRCGVVTISARRAPALICERIVVRLLHAKSTWPPRSEVVTSPPLL